MTSFQNEDRVNICLVAAIPLSLLVFMKPHIRALSRYCNITLVANSDFGDISPLLNSQVTFKNLKIKRKIAIFSDFIALINLWKIFRNEKFELVQSITPKAGLLSMVAGRLAGISVRVHWFTGQVWATKKGLQRWFLKLFDRLLSTCATHLFADSVSQCEFLSKEGIVQQSEISVLGKGSVCGIDTALFKPNPKDRKKKRLELNISEGATIALYLGRLNQEKGLPELAKAYLKAAQECADLHLLVVGPDEEQMRDFVSKVLSEFSDRVHFVDYTNEPQAFFAAADFFVLPSHREGFGSSVIEAAACGIPTIGTNIYGLTDAIVHEKTGLQFPVGNVAHLTKAMIRLAKDRSFRLYLGEQARQRAVQDFNQDALTQEMIEHYLRFLELKINYS